MSRDAVNRFCAELPGAERSDPWGGGHDCWKVGGKMFAVVAAVNPTLSVKTESADTAAMLIEAGEGERAPYFHASWIAVSLDAPDDRLRHRIITSYGLIFDRLPRKVRDALAS